MLINGNPWYRWVYNCALKHNSRYMYEQCSILIKLYTKKKKKTLLNISEYV